MTMKRFATFVVAVALAILFVVPTFAGVVRVNGDNEWSVFINGELKDTGDNWQVATITEFDESGAVVIAIYVHDAEPGAAGVGGFLADIVLDDGTYITTEDPRWVCDAGLPLADRNDGWEKPDYDDSGWGALTIMDQFGGGVWGFGADTMRQTLKDPDSTSFWAWCGPNDGEDDVYFRITLGSATAVEPKDKLPVRWAELKASR